MKFIQKQLDNGLCIVAEVNPSAASMAAGFFVRTGSRDETSEVAGVSHFLEHMLFKGTERRTAAEVNRDFDRIGANYNAMTSEENTVYYGAVLPEFEADLLDILCDILRPTLRQDDFDIEKQVILDEIAVYDDLPHFRVYDAVMAEHFLPHPAGNSILGTRKTVGDLSRSQMQTYFDQQYSPGNITLVAVGDVDFDALVSKAGEICSSWPQRNVERQMPPAKANEKTRVIHDPRVTRQHIGLMSPAPPRQSPDHYAAELLSCIVGDTTGSRLFYALIEPALADDASMGYAPMDGVGAFMTYASCDPHRAPKVLETIRRELRRLCDDGPTEAEVLAAKNKIASGATLRGELPMGRLSAVGSDWVYMHKYIPLADQIDTLFDVSAKDIWRVGREWDLTQSTIVTLGPIESL